MAEEYTLTTPEVKPEVRNNAYKVQSLFFDWANGIISVTLKGQNNETIATGYGGPTASLDEKNEAIKMMKQLNTANLTSNSLQKRVLTKLSQDGKIPPGNTTGTPDPV